MDLIDREKQFSCELLSLTLLKGAMMLGFGAIRSLLYYFQARFINFLGSVALPRRAELSVLLMAENNRPPYVTAYASDV